MKTRLLVILMLVTTLVACKKQSNSTAGSNKSSSPPAPTATTLNDSAMADAALVGVWTADSTQSYSSGILLSTTMPAGACSYTLTANPYPYPAGNHHFGYYGCNGVTPSFVEWYVDKSEFNSTGLLKTMTEYIRTLDAHHLVLGSNPGSVKEGAYRYYHK